MAGAERQQINAIKLFPFPLPANQCSGVGRVGNWYAHFRTLSRADQSGNTHPMEK